MNDINTESSRAASNGRDQLWLWFGLSYASWLTLPRSMMHEMPDDWQKKMAELLHEWDTTWNTAAMPATKVQGVRSDGRLTKFPAALLNYRHPDRKFLLSLKSDHETEDACQ